MIGVSLSTKWFYEPQSAPYPLEQVFDFLRRKNVKSIELRSVRPVHDENLVRAAAQLVWDNGFNLTIHGRVSSLETCISDVFGNLESTLANMKQELLIITIHPIVGDNYKMLITLSDYITEKGYPVKIALENNRLMPNKEEGDSAAHVLDTVREVDRKNIGICFDMGHLAYYVKKNCNDDPNYEVNPEFLKRVIHTHMHATNGLITHFPPADDEVRLASFMNALAHRYFGIYNIELDFPRMKKLWEPLDALDCIINYVENNLSHCARLYDRIRESFDSSFISCVDLLKKAEGGTTLGVLNASSYLFNTDGFLWGVDPAFMNARHLAKSAKRVNKILGDFKLFLISHSHGDHFERKTVGALCQNDVKWVIPDFLLDKALGYGIERDNIIVATKGVLITVGNLEIIPFESAHVRKDAESGMMEYGYFVKTKDGKTLVFPVDVRNYEKPLPDNIPTANYCFSHLWLGDNTDFKKCREYLEPFAKYMLGFSDQNILIGHLYENGRSDKYMWRVEHAEMAKQKIKEISDSTNVHILTHATLIKL